MILYFYNSNFIFIISFYLNQIERTFEKFWNERKSIFHILFIQYNKYDNIYTCTNLISATKMSLAEQLQVTFVLEIVFSIKVSDFLLCISINAFHILYIYIIFCKFCLKANLVLLIFKLHSINYIYHFSNICFWFRNKFKFSK